MAQAHISTELSTDQTRVKYYDRNCIRTYSNVKRKYDRACIQKQPQRLFEIKAYRAERGQS